MRTTFDSGQRTFALMISLASLLILVGATWMSCHVGRGRRIQSELEVMRVDSLNFNYNLIFLCSRDDGPFVALSEKDSSSNVQPTPPGFALLEEGRTYIMELVEVVKPPALSFPTMGGPPVEGLRVYQEPCDTVGDSLALLWSAGRIRTKIYRSDDIVGLYVRVRD